MKRFLLIFSFFAGMIFSVTAQTGHRPASIFDELESTGAGTGTVRVYQDPALRQLVGRYLSGNGIERNDSLTYLKMQGFRAQVFSGNNQRKSKEEAIRKEKMIKELYPDLPTYVTYTAPFWKLRVGDFRSREEAYSLIRDLKETFPSFAKEMYIVKDEVKIPL